MPLTCAYPATTGDVPRLSRAQLGCMIEIVLPNARFAHAATLIQMHHDRKRVFIDRLNWDLPHSQSWLEVDDFDNEHAVYLVARSPVSGHHDGSVRLLPTSTRHMLGSIFSHLCESDVPVSQSCWEISRFVTSPPEIAGTSVVKVHRLLALALLEFAKLNGILHYTLVTESRRLPALLSIGWKVEPLGLPAICAGQELQALQITTDEQVASELRKKLGIRGALLGIESRGRVAA